MGKIKIIVSPTFIETHSDNEEFTIVISPTIVEASGSSLVDFGFSVHWDWSQIKAGEHHTSATYIQANMEEHNWGGIPATGVVLGNTTGRTSYFWHTGFNTGPMTINFRRLKAGISVIRFVVESMAAGWTLEAPAVVVLNKPAVIDNSAPTYLLVVNPVIHNGVTQQRVGASAPPKRVVAWNPTDAALSVPQPSGASKFLCVVANPANICFSASDTDSQFDSRIGLAGEYSALPTGAIAAGTVNTMYLSYADSYTIPKANIGQQLTVDVAPLSQAQSAALGNSRYRVTFQSSPVTRLFDVSGVAKSGAYSSPVSISVGSNPTVSNAAHLSVGSRYFTTSATQPYVDVDVYLEFSGSEPLRSLGFDCWYNSELIGQIQTIMGSEGERDLGWKTNNFGVNAPGNQAKNFRWFDWREESGVGSEGLRANRATGIGWACKSSDQTLGIFGTRAGTHYTKKKIVTLRVPRTSVGVAVLRFVASSLSDGWSLTAPVVVVNNLPTRIDETLPVEVIAIGPIVYSGVEVRDSTALGPNHPSAVKAWDPEQPGWEQPDPIALADRARLRSCHYLIVVPNPGTLCCTPSGPKNLEFDETCIVQHQPVLSRAYLTFESSALALEDLTASQGTISRADDSYNVDNDPTTDKLYQIDWSSGWPRMTGSTVNLIQAKLSLLSSQSSDLSQLVAFVGVIDSTKYGHMYYSAALYPSSSRSDVAAAINNLGQFPPIDWDIWWQATGRELLYAGEDKSARGSHAGWWGEPFYDPVYGPYSGIFLKLQDYLFVFDHADSVPRCIASYPLGVDKVVNPEARPSVDLIVNYLTRPREPVNATATGRHLVRFVHNLVEPSQYLSASPSTSPSPAPLIQPSPSPTIAPPDAGIVISIADDFLDTFCMEIPGPTGRVGDVGDPGAPGKDGYTDGPPGEKGETGIDAVNPATFTGIEIVESDDLTNSPVVSLEYDSAKQRLTFTRSRVVVPDSNAPAEQFVVLPTQRKLYFPEVAQDAHNYITLDDWTLAAPADDPLVSSPDLILLRCPDQSYSGDVIDVDPIRLSDYLHKITAAYKERLDTIQAQWMEQARTYLMSKDAAARQLLSDLAQQLAECEFGAPIEFCLGIETTDCLTQSGETPPTSTIASAEGVRSYREPVIEPAPAIAEATKPDVLSQEVTTQALATCTTPYRILLIFLIDEAAQCYVHNQCGWDPAVSDPDLEPPAAEIVYDYDKRIWEDYLRLLPAAQQIVVGVLQVAKNESGYSGDVNDLKYPGRDMPIDSRGQIVYHRIVANPTAEAVVNYTNDILDDLMTNHPTTCYYEDAPVNLVLLVAHQKLLSATGVQYSSLLTDAAEAIRSEWWWICIEHRAGWSDVDHFDATPPGPARWLWTLRQLARRFLCFNCDVLPAPGVTAQTVERRLLLVVMTDDADCYGNGTYWLAGGSRGEWDGDLALWDEVISTLAPNEKVKLALWCVPLRDEVLAEWAAAQWMVRDDPQMLYYRMPVESMPVDSFGRGYVLQPDNRIAGSDGLPLNRNPNLAIRARGRVITQADVTWFLDHACSHLGNFNPTEVIILGDGSGSMQCSEQSFLWRGLNVLTIFDCRDWWYEMQAREAVENVSTLGDPLALPG